MPQLLGREAAAPSNSSNEVKFSHETDRNPLLPRAVARALSHCNSCTGVSSHLPMEVTPTHVMALPSAYVSIRQHNKRTKRTDAENRSSANAANRRAESHTPECCANCWFYHCFLFQVFYFENASSGMICHPWSLMGKCQVTC